ncbi:MAG: hypothetical protein BM564_01095 [Bacteroidetes bacterium MedPE-SWsnd-G2]|nr:MAG: hypothetical protein BM564_01095 [Bacteroidetes bacterium MedPE-SWsnd-G2]
MHNLTEKLCLPLFLVLLSFLSQSSSFAQVGIGTRDPQTTLDVNGTFAVRGLIENDTINTVMVVDTSTHEVHYRNLKSLHYNMWPSGGDDAVVLTELLEQANGVEPFLVNMAPGMYYFNTSVTNFKNNVIIKGNGSNINSTFVGELFYLNQKIGIEIKDVNFHSSNSGSSYAQNRMDGDKAIKAYKTKDILISGCKFQGFLDTAIDMYNHTGDKLHQANRIVNNIFNECWGGATIWYNSEYGILSNNIFKQCRYAILNNSGNWNLSGNITVKCRAALISQNVVGDTNFAVGGNLNHGNYSGNSFNHCGNGFWNSSVTEMTVGSSVVDITGIYFKGIISPQISGGSIWFTDIYLEDTNATYGMVITGCTIATSNINAVGTSTLDLYGNRMYNVSTSGAVVIH